MAVDITTIGIEYDTSGLIAGTNAQNQTTASANKMGDALASNEQQTKANNTASKAYATTLGALAAAFGVSQITRQIDEYTKYTAQLKLASNSNNEYLQSLDAVRKIATDSQASLAGTGTLYARIANGTRELGVAQSQVAKITESVNLSLKVSGATAAEAASAQLQLSQSFASGTLRGEEFNAVNEAAPRLMKALADGIGVPVGALKDMASNGLITSEIMARVLPQALDQLREEAKSVQTLSGAFQVLKNNMMEFIGIQAQSNGIVSVLTSGIGLLASNLDILAGALITVAAVKFGNFLTSITTSAYSTVTANRALALSNLETARTNAVATASTLALADARVIELRQAVLAASGEAALAVTMNGLIPAQARAMAASIAHTEALAVQTVAAGAASTGMGVLRGAMAFLGGPIGLIITALGIAATAWSVFGDSAETANEKTKVSSLETTNEVIARLDVEISKLKERNKLRDSGVSISGASEANQAALAKAKKDYEDAIAGTGGFSAPNEIAKAELIKATGAAYGTLLNKVKEVSDETEKLNGKTQSNKLAEWLGKNGTQAQKMAAAFAEAKKEVGVLTPEMESLIRLKFADKTATKSLTIEEEALHTARKQGTKLDLEMAKEFDKSMKQFAKDQINRTKEVTKSITDNILEQGKNYLSLKNKIEQYTDSLNESNDLSKLEMSLIGSSNSERQIAIEQYKIALTLKKQLAEIDAKNLSQGDKNILIQEAQTAANLAKSQVELKAQQTEWTSFFSDIYTGLSDSLYRSFESGKGFAKTFIDSLKNLFKTNVIKIAVQAVMGGGLSLSGLANASTGAGSAASSIGGLSSLVSGASSLFGSTGFMSSLAGGLNGAGVGSGLTSSLGLTIGNSVSSVLGSSVSGAISSGISAASSVLAAVPVWGWAALAGGALLGSIGGGGDRVTGAQNVSGTLGTNDISRNVDFTKSGGLFGKSDSGTWNYNLGTSAAIASNGRSYTDTASQASDTAMLQTINSTYAALVDAGKGFAVSLGMSADVVTSTTDKINFAIGKTQEETDAAMQAAFGQVADNIAQRIIPSILSMTKEGESASQALQRVATGFSSVNMIFGDIGLKLFEMNDAGLKASSVFVDLVGGLEGLQTVTQSYYDTYFTEAEKNAKILEAVTSEFAKQNLALPDSIAGYRALVEEISKTGTPEQLASLLNMNQAFASIVSSVDQVTEASKAALAMQAAISQERAGLQSEYDNLTLSEEEKLKRKRDALYSDNQGLFDQIQGKYAEIEAAKLAAAAYEEQRKAQEDAMAAIKKAEDDAFNAQYQAAKAIVDVWSSASTSIIEEVKRIRGEISSSGSNSFGAAQSQFAISTAQARAGDVEAAKLLPSLSQALLSIAETQSSSLLELNLIRAQTSQSLVDTLMTVQTSTGIGLPSFAVGTNYVPHDMIAQIHEGEAIVPKAYNNKSSESDKTLISTLIQRVEMLSFELKAIAGHTASTARTLDRVVIDDKMQIGTPANDPIETTVV